MRDPRRGSGRRAERWAVLAAAAVSCGITAAIFTAGTYLLTVGSRGFRGVGDDHVYLYMTTHPVGAFHIAPWCWRIGVPALVRYLPMNPQTGYQVVALISTALTGLLVYLIARAWGFGRTFCLTGLLLFFSFGYATKFNLKDFWLTDATAFTFAAAAVLALLHRRRLLFAAFLLVGVFAKESVIFVAPLAYTFEARTLRDGRALLRACLLALPAATALVVLRTAIPAWNSVPGYVASLPRSVRSDIGNLPTYNLLTVAAQTLTARSHHWLLTIGHTLSTFGLVPMVLAPLAGWELRPVVGRFWPLVALTLAQLVFALNTQRLVVVAFVPVIIACLTGARQVADRFGVAVGWFPVAAAAAVGMEFLQPAQSSPTPPLQVAVVGGLVAAVWVGTRWRRGSRSTTGTPAPLSTAVRCVLPPVRWRRPAGNAAVDEDHPVDG